MSILDFVSYLSPELGDMISMVLAAVLIFNVVSGLMYCFFGYKIYRLVIMIQGFLGGAVVGAIIGLFTRSEIGIFICAFCIGVLGAFLSWYLFYIGVFFQAFWTGMLITIVVMLGTGGFDTSIISAAVMAGIFLGVLACILIKVAIVFLTAFSGALTVGATIGAMGSLELPVTIVICVVLFTLGFLFQMFMSRKKKPAVGVSPEAAGAAEPRTSSVSAPLICGIVGAVIAFFLCRMWRNFLYGLYFYSPVLLVPFRILNDICFCAGGYGIGYFIAKKVNEKNDAYPLDFSLSNNAVICGFGGAVIGLILRVLSLIGYYWVGFFTMYSVKYMFNYATLITCFGGFTLGYLIYSRITRKPVPEAARPVSAARPAASGTQTQAARPVSAFQTANPVPGAGTPSYGQTAKSAAGAQAASRTAETFPERERLFAPDIDNELNYVFPKDILCMMKTMPVINDDGSWGCSCGRLCRDEHCNVCGMAKEDIKTKFTYQYLKKHREERLAREAEEERIRQAELEKLRKEEEARRQAEAEERRKQAEARAKERQEWQQEQAKKAKEQAEKAKERAKVQGKRLKGAAKRHIKLIILIAVLLILAIGYRMSPSGRANYYIFKASMAEGSKRENYLIDSLEAKPTAKAYEKLWELGGYGDGYYLSCIRDLFPKRYEELKKKWPAKAPEVSLKNGEYDEAQDVYMTGAEESDIVYYRLYEGDCTGKTLDPEQENGLMQWPGEALVIDTNGTYTLLVWAKNKYGFWSDVSTYVYTINMKIPDAVTASNGEEHYFVGDVEISLSQNEGFDIYYTTDGTEPTKDSIPYSGPIACSRGITHIRAISYSDKDIESEIMDDDIYVRYATDDNLIYGMSKEQCGNRYDYFSYNGRIAVANPDNAAFQFLDGGSKDYIPSIYFHGNILYFSNPSIGVYTYSEETDSIGKITDSSAEMMAVWNGRLYLVSTRTDMAPGFVELDDSGATYSSGDSSVSTIAQAQSIEAEGLDFGGVFVRDGRLFMSAKSNSDNTFVIYEVHEDNTLTESERCNFDGAQYCTNVYELAQGDLLAETTDLNGSIVRVKNGVSSVVLQGEPSTTVSRKEAVLWNKGTEQDTRIYYNELSTANGKVYVVKGTDDVYWEWNRGQEDMATKTIENQVEVRGVLNVETGIFSTLPGEASRCARIVHENGYAYGAGLLLMNVFGADPNQNFNRIRLSDYNY